MPDPKLYIVPKEPAHGRETPNNLVAQPAPLVGRESELAAVCSLLTDDDVRLLTLLGPGGVGKTRLALQVAEEMLAYFIDGVYFVDLAAITDPGLVLPVIAATLHIREARDAPLLENLRRWLEGRKVLLLLDNFEQIIPAGQAVAELLALCPDLKVLLTSRSTLRLRIEREFALSPLALPAAGRHMSAEALARYGAVDLFAQRARALRPNFELKDTNANTVAEICRRVDGLPLAIELVAAHARLLTPHDILARLRHPLRLLASGTADAPSRHQTMRDTIEWSYGLLSDKEQTLFRRVSVFVGGFALQAVEVVCTPELDREAGEILAEEDHPLVIELLESLEGLAEKSLLRRLEFGADESPYLAMLETVREYARELLAAGGEAAAMRRRHAHYYAWLAEEAGRASEGRDMPRVWLDRLSREQDNLRAAVGWLLEQGDAPVSRDVLRMLRASNVFWDRRGRPGELYGWLERALAQLGSEPDPLTIWALKRCSLLVRMQGDYPGARAWAERAVAMAEELGDSWEATEALNLLAQVALMQGEYSTARSLMEAALSVYREREDGFRVAGTLNNLGEVSRYQGDYRSANAYYMESLEIFRALGEKTGVLFALVNTGHAAQHLGNLEGARARFLEALALAQEAESPRVAAEALIGLCGIILAEARSEDLASLEQVARLCGLAAGLLERTGRQLDPTDQGEFDQYVAVARANLDEQTYTAAWQEGQAMSLDQAFQAAGLKRRRRSRKGQGVTTGASVSPATHAQRGPRGRRKQGTGGLTGREYEIATLVARGLTNGNIAHELVLSERTVEMHVSNALRKLGLATRAELAAWVVRQSLTSGEPGSS